MEKQEQILIDEIRSLFEELIKEEKERYDLTTRRTIYPDGCIYALKAKELYRKAVELEKIDTKYHTWELKDVMGDEVELVNLHKNEYHGNTPKAKSIVKLQSLMHNATYHIRLYFYEVLGNIELK